MIGRRGFIGSIIGIATTLMLPFKAVEAEEGITVEAKPVGDLEKFRMGIIMKDGTKIWAPGIDDVTIKGQEIIFKASDIQATKEWVAKGLFLYSPRGRICAKKDFHCLVPLADGDTLKVQYTLTLGDCDPNNWSLWEPAAVAKFANR